MVSKTRTKMGRAISCSEDKRNLCLAVQKRWNHSTNPSLPIQNQEVLCLKQLKRRSEKPKKSMQIERISTIISKGMKTSLIGYRNAWNELRRGGTMIS